ncbi:mitochondrial 37s ribosomal protein mrps9 [Diplodia corticola]|uniref:Small ribosomal subunit protein uS9m n=1 Tax=Diplodia corticola TaxID=236234 RepID=A0A1J9QRY0_9PEZI|nr:mitochondrial 37s ribosomal protein mrps9 [Diplodia corticola]OJD30754.1 mitochondrial 37s ribosomal protein mrps9 [Diplodia corticola]
MASTRLATSLPKAARSVTLPLRPRIRQDVASLRAYRPDATSFSTSASCRAFESHDSDLQSFQAAPPIDFGDRPGTPPLLSRVRVVPASPSYFTAKPNFVDDFLELQAILRKYQTLPMIEPVYAPRVAWKSLSEYKVETNEPIRIAKWRKLQKILQRLNYIHPTIIPDEVTQIMNRYKRAINPYDRKPKLRSLDEMGRGMGVGRRKTTSAVAWLVEGEGEVMINGKSLTEAFNRVHDRESAIWALKATNRVDKYNVWALIRGGGTTGRAEALTLAIANALMVHEPGLKPALRRAGCVTRDPRKVERKKPGHIKARKMPTWVKR